MFLRTLEESSILLNVSLSTLRAWIKRGAPHVLLNPDAKGTGRRIRLNPEEVLAWAKENLNNKHNAKNDENK